MKKILFILFIIIISSLRINASSNSYYEEKLYDIELYNLSNKSINSVFDNLDIFMVDITINIDSYTDTFKINTYITKDIEREITKRIVSKLIDQGAREKACLVEVKGYSVIKASLYINEHTYNLIINRLKK